MISKEDKQNQLILAKWLYKYRDTLPKIAVPKLMEVDYIRAHYSKSTVYAKLTQVQAYLRGGKATCMAQELKKYINKLIDEDNPINRDKIISAIIKGKKARGEIVDVKQSIEERQEPAKPARRQVVTWKATWEQADEIQKQIDFIEEKCNKECEKINERIKKMEESKNLILHVARMKISELQAKKQEFLTEIGRAHV